jgi:hypothetical protein
MRATWSKKNGELKRIFATFGHSAWTLTATSGHCGTWSGRTLGPAIKDRARPAGWGKAMRWWNECGANIVTSKGDPTLLRGCKPPIDLTTEFHHQATSLLLSDTETTATNGPNGASRNGYLSWVSQLRHWWGFTNVSFPGFNAESSQMEPKPDGPADTTSRTPCEAETPF